MSRYRDKDRNGISRQAMLVSGILKKPMAMDGAMKPRGRDEVRKRPARDMSEAPEWHGALREHFGAMLRSKGASEDEVEQMCTDAIEHLARSGLGASPMGVAPGDDRDDQDTTAEYGAIAEANEGEEVNEDEMGENEGEGGFSKEHIERAKMLGISPNQLDGYKTQKRATGEDSIAGLLRLTERIGGDFSDGRRVDPATPSSGFVPSYGVSRTRALKRRQMATDRASGSSSTSDLVRMANRIKVGVW